MTESPSTWLLCDDRLSHRSQISGVAERLGWPCLEKEIRYNRLAELANGPFGARLWHLTPESRVQIMPPWPDLVITAGRRCAPVALAIKKRSPGTKLVQLMWPDIAPKRFDLIAVPEHDNLNHNGPHILRTFGAPHHITGAKLDAAAAHWHAQVARMPRPYITLLVGGTSRDIHYEREDFRALAAYASGEADRLGGSLLISTSARTGKAAEELMKPIFTVPHLYHRFQDPGENPYTAFLGLADVVIATGDSVSMCSEACVTTRPVYIFVPPHLPRDTSSFREILFARGHAKPHTYPIRTDWQPMQVQDAAQNVADAIRMMLQQKH